MPGTRVPKHGEGESAACGTGAVERLDREQTSVKSFQRCGQRGYHFVQRKREDVSQELPDRGNCVRKEVGASKVGQYFKAGKERGAPRNVWVLSKTLKLLLHQE
jgi:hypothetical protein